MDKIIYEVTLFGLKLKFSPIAFTLPFGGGWSVYWYGIMIALGFLLAVIYAMFKADRYGVDKDRMLDVVLLTTPLAILCARGYYCIFENQEGTKISSIAEFFGIGSGHGFSGLAIYGGVIGAFVFGLLMCKLRKVNPLNMFDLTATGFLIGQGVGRWGNFFNQEAFGKLTGSTWFGMSSSQTHGMVHPCFLYESIWCIAGFFVLNHFSKKRRFSGQITLMYGVWYGFGRFFIEYLRTDSLMIGQIKVSMLLSALLVLVCGGALYYLLKRANNAAKVVEYSGLFKEQMDEENVETNQEDETSDYQKPVEENTLQEKANEEKTDE